MSSSSSSKQSAKRKKPVTQRKTTASRIGSRREIKTAFDKWIEKNPNGSIADFHRQFYPTFTYNQIVGIVRGKVKMDYKPRVDKGTTKAPTKEAAQPLYGDLDKVDLFEENIKKGLYLLKSQNVAVTDHAFSLQKYASADKHNTDMKLLGQLKRIDAGVLAEIIRMFQPDATNEDVVLIYRTAEARFKESRRAD